MNLSPPSPKQSQLTIVDSTFSIFEKFWDKQWHHFHDTLFPYGDDGDRRQAYFHTVWTFKLEHDLLLFTKSDAAGQLPLSLLRERLITFSDFTPCSPPHAPHFELEKKFPLPHWNPILHTSHRNNVFAHRLLNDFNYQWRHVLRNRYNDFTFWQLVTAILRLATSDFETVELHEPFLNIEIRGPFVCLLDLPTWQPWDRGIFLLGRVWIVATQDPADAIPLIRQHFDTHPSTASNEPYNHTEHYLILSVRQILLCHVNPEKMLWTAPESFLNGDQTPCSDRAIDLLLLTLSPLTERKPQSALQALPIEIQNQILAHVSRGPVEAARLGCVLGLGSPFLWHDGKAKICRKRSDQSRTENSYVESQIWFGEGMSGLAYRAGA